jgi:hypothetical protein
MQVYHAHFYHGLSGKNKNHHTSRTSIIILLSGVRLSPLGTAATTGLLYQLQMIGEDLSVKRKTKSAKTNHEVKTRCYWTVGKNPNQSWTTKY